LSVTVLADHSFKLSVIDVLEWQLLVHLFLMV
jgi:hypothetical protein